MKTELIAPAPWSLSGNGLVLLYHFPKEFNFKYGFLEKFQQNKYLGLMGAVMLINYQTSGVGSYAELLFMPGLIRSAGWVGFTISKIYVSTVASQENGYHNWGIPKELANFTFTEPLPGQGHIKVAREGKLFFEASYKTHGPKIPISTKILPFTQIIQQRPPNLLLTPIAASGKMQLSSLNILFVEPANFPPVNKLSCLAALAVQDFKMVFSVAEVIF